MKRKLILTSMSVLSLAAAITNNPITSEIIDDTGFLWGG